MNQKDLSEWSYQRYARFYGELKPSDPNFNEKINKIYDLIVNKKYNDLNVIAKETGCSFDEVIMKIRYLENKRMIENLHIDTLSGKIRECSLEDEKILKKYSSFLYNNHYQIKEMAVRLPGATKDRLPELEDQVFEEIAYLDSKGLINGISLDKESRKITYYTIEKNKEANKKVTINCPFCGAINDVYKDNRTKCSYCKKIIEYNGENLKPIEEKTKTDEVVVAPAIPNKAPSSSAPKPNNEPKLADDYLYDYIGNNARKITTRSFNFSALFFGCYYYFYRKHYVFGVINFLLLLLFPFFGPKIGIKSIYILYGIPIAFSILFAALFNGNYVNMARNNIAKIKMDNKGISSNVLSMKIRDKGGTSAALLIASIVAFSVLFKVLGLDSAFLNNENIIPNNDRTIKFDGGATFTPGDGVIVLDQVDLDSNINITIPEVFKPSIMNSKTSYDYSYSYDQNGNSCEFGCIGECDLKIQTVLGFKNANEFANFLAKEHSGTISNKTINNIPWTIAKYSFIGNTTDYVTLRNNELYHISLSSEGDKCESYFNDIMNSFSFK